MAWFRGEDAWLQGAVLAIVSTVHLTTVVGILPPWLGASRAGIAVQVSGNALAAMIYRTYYLAATTEPGSVPQGWVRTRAREREKREEHERRREGVGGMSTELEH